MRFAAAAIPDRVGRWEFTCVGVVGLGFGFVGWVQESFGSVVVVDPGLAGVRTRRPSSRLVVGRRGSAGLIGVIVPDGAQRFRFAAATVPDRFGR